MDWLSDSEPAPIASRTGVFSPGKDNRSRQLKFGDFQTPVVLVREIFQLIAQMPFHPKSVLDPTCGIGGFLGVARDFFPNIDWIGGVDINPAYIRIAKDRLGGNGVMLAVADFFQTDWESLIAQLPEPLLVVGNPPWVTSSRLGRLGEKITRPTVPEPPVGGLAGLTGKGDFDISEYIITTVASWLNTKEGMLGMLCKTATARKVLFNIWQKQFRISEATIYRLETSAYFPVSIESCLLLLRSGNPDGRNTQKCKIFASLLGHREVGCYQPIQGRLLANADLYRRWAFLARTSPASRWRSGIKHDCQKVFELKKIGGKLFNGFGEELDLEDEVVFPLLKGSDLIAKRSPSRWVLVPQTSLSCRDEDIRLNYPKTWEYLQSKLGHLRQRKSRIYTKANAHFLFGVGDYSFSMWKIAVAGFNKKLEFIKIPPYMGKPVLFDDTCYFLPCESERDCDYLMGLVTSGPAHEFWSSLIFWDSKRPITAEILNLLDLNALERLLQGITTGETGSA